ERGILTVSDSSTLAVPNPGEPGAVDVNPHDPGAFAWVVLFFAFGVYTLTFIDRLAWGSVAASAGASLGMSVAALGVFVTGFYATYVISNAAGGFLIDWVGPRRMVLLGLVPLGLLTFLFGYTPSVLIGLILQAGMGIAAGIDYTACIKLVASWFPLRTRGKAMGLFMVGSSLGVVLTNAVIPTLLNHFGWRGAYKCLGALTILWGVAAYLIIRNGPSRQKSSAKPDYSLVFRNRNLLFLALAGFGAFWGIVGFTNWASALLVKGFHLSLVRAGFVVALFGVGAMLGKPLIGFVSDWLGGRYKSLSLFCMGSFAVMLLLFGRMSTETAFLYLAPFAGLTCQWSIPLMATMITEELTVTLAGSATGLTNAIWQLSGAIVPIAVGRVFQATHSFSMAFLVLAAGPAAGVLVLLFVQERKRPAGS
ncbi:MAG: MFS transporter, partial [Candidatus Acidiferrales bacterium]